MRGGTTAEFSRLGTPDERAGRDMAAPTFAGRDMGRTDITSQGANKNGPNKTRNKKRSLRGRSVTKLVSDQDRSSGRVTPLGVVFKAEAA